MWIVPGMSPGMVSLMLIVTQRFLMPDLDDAMKSSCSSLTISLSTQMNIKLHKWQPEVAEKTRAS
jgi:hypothetical protein